MEVFDKVSWQVDGGVEKSIVINHFDFMFSWLHEKGLLSAQGEEMYKFGADGSTSISDNDLTDEGSKFMKKYYDTYISKVEYGVHEDTELLDSIWKQQ